MSSHIFITSTHRNRNAFPNPASFDIRYASTGTDGILYDVKDFVSEFTPLINVDMNSLFDDTYVTTFPYNWYKTGTIIAPTVDSTVSYLTITFAGNPNIPSDYYTGLVFSYNDGFITQNSIITSFVNLNNDTYRIGLSVPIDFTDTATSCQIQSIVLTTNTVYIPPNISINGTDNEFVGYTLFDYINNKTALITGFNATSRILTLNTDLTVIPTFYVITKKPYFYLYTITATTSNSITFTSTADQHFQYQYITNLASNITTRINSVTSVGNVYTCILQSVSGFSMSDTILFLPYTYDNDIPITNISMQSVPSQPVCMDIQLLSIHIPNVLLGRHPGGFLVDYPYVIVELENITAAHTTSNVFYTNDPKLNKALFICPVQDISSRDYSLFVKLNGSAITQTIKFKMNDSFRFAVKLPDGTPIQFSETDTLPPSAPNSFLQISALFAVSKSNL